MHGIEHPSDLLAVHPTAQFLQRHVSAEAEPYLGPLERYPGLGFAVRYPEVLLRERQVGMGVDR